MQRRYNLAYFIIASIVGLGFMSLMISVDAQAQIAFVSNRDEHSWEIYVMDVDGGNPQRLTNSPEVEWSPSWSPDGKRTVFSSEKDEHQWKQDIYVMDADGGNLRNLTNNAAMDSSPAWFHPALSVSPAGKKLTMWGWLKQVVR